LMFGTAKVVEVFFLSNIP